MSEDNQSQESKVIRDGNQKADQVSITPDTLSSKIWFEIPDKRKPHKKEGHINIVYVKEKLKEFKEDLIEEGVAKYKAISIMRLNEIFLKRFGEELCPQDNI